MGAACATGAIACVDLAAARAYVAGGLPPRARAAIEGRIEACPGCRAVVADAAAGDTVAEVAPRGERMAPLAPGEQVGRYVVERALAAGGMGVVSLARDPALRRAVVLKLVRPDVREAGGDFEARLEREAQAMAQLSHPNVVQIFDLGRHGARIFLAMEYVPGSTLDAWLIERARTPTEIIAMFLQAGAGLDAAHRAGLIHRDFKPTNVLVDPAGVAKVTDFGLARGTRRTEPSDTAVPRSSGVHAVLTHADAIVGTPAYMAPEQLAGDPVDARSDQYSFALTLVDALLEQQPLRRRVDPTRDATAEAIDAALATAGAPPAARAALIRALATAPGDRFPGVGELLRALAPSGAPRRARWPLALAVVAAAAAASGVAIAVSRDAATRGDARCARAARWPVADRAAVVAGIAGRPQPFAAWTAARVEAQLDLAVDHLVAAEVAACERADRAAPDTSADACIARRRDALDAARTALRAGTGDPLAAIHGLDACAPPGLHVDEGAAADRHLAGAAAALARHDATTAEHELRAAALAAERAGDDARRARALLALLDVARVQGDHAAATRDADALRALIARNGAAAADDHAVARGEAAAFGELGDVARAARAWDRAEAVASGADIARALAGRAWFDREQRFATGAGPELAAALARLPGPAPREVQRIVGDLALAAGDGAGALAAYRAAAEADPLRLARARAAAGEVDGALAELDALAERAGATPGDPLAGSLARLRIAAARGEVLLAAGRAREAVAALDEAADSVAPHLVSRPDRRLPPLPYAERFALLLLRCRAEIAAEVANTTCSDLDPLLAPLAPNAPARAQLLLARAADARQQRMRFGGANHHRRAIEVMIAARVDRTAIAREQWALARDESALDKERAQLAAAARATFAAVGDRDLVADIDRAFPTAAAAAVAPPTTTVPPTTAAPRDPWNR